MNFLSRDVVFLFPKDSSGMEFFFKNLFETTSTGKVFQDLPNNILASLSIEIKGEKCENLDSFVFKYEGDQILPYMDLINTLTKIADFHGLNAKFNDDYFKSKYFDFPVIFESIMRQSTGHLDSGHSSLLK